MAEKGFSDQLVSTIECDLLIQYNSNTFWKADYRLGGCENRINPRSKYTNNTDN